MTMGFRLFVLSILLISTLTYAQGRKPAVEDFVGIEVSEEKVTPRGNETLFNLEQDISKIEAEKDKPLVKKAPVATSPSGLGALTIMAITLGLTLPALVWFMVMSHLRKKASVESASNIEVLEKYRRDREKKTEDSVKKAS